jgi:diaminopimelate decarboxylase
MSQSKELSPAGVGENTYYKEQMGKVSMFMEEVSLGQLAREHGTPLFVYSRRSIEQAINAYHSGLKDREYQIYYAVKANSNLAIIQLIAQQGCGADIVSAGELQRALKAGVSADKIVFSGVGKTASEMRQALLAGKSGIACFNIESKAEIEVLDKVALSLGRVAPISIRVNPDIDAKTHPYISTGLKSNKFGISHTEALSVYEYAASKKGLKIKGIDCHIGSQITEFEPYLDCVDRLSELVNRIEATGIYLEHIDFGGGWGVRYYDEEVPSPQRLWEKMLERLDRYNLGHKKICLEPGRSIVANAGLCLTQVLYVKENEEKNFCIVDAAMNDLPRPAMYQAYHQIIPVVLRASGKETSPKLYDVVGPVCETGDWLGKDRELDANQGDLLAVMSAGAYCMSMASQYNSRPRATELLVSGSSVHIIREREELENQFSQERLLPATEFSNR